MFLHEEEDIYLCKQLFISEGEELIKDTKSAAENLLLHYSIYLNSDTVNFAIKIISQIPSICTIQVSGTCM